MKTYFEQQGPENTTVRITHGSMRHNRDGIYPESKDSTIWKKITPAPDVFLTAHTHRPLVRKVNQTLVVNSGSVGLPFDGDQRAAYAQLSWRSGKWTAQIIRLRYDIEKTRIAYDSNQFYEGAGPLTRIMYAELERADSILYGWVIRYGEAVLAGDLNIDASVDDYLCAI
jgi:diadenosine tetraphosphatase ApaH/serine/threonine PP2A family protein phosphatase